MKWHESEIKILDLPDGQSVMLVGTLDEGIVKIGVEFYRNDECWTVVEFEKYVKMWRDNSTINEEVEEKYLDKLHKARSKHEGMPYKDWVAYFVSRPPTKGNLSTE